LRSLKSFKSSSLFINIVQLNNKLNVEDLADKGTLSEGFIRKVFPAVVAGGNIHSGIIAGKLKGAMPAHTPSGIR
jgi:hypothetical protein